MAGLLARAEVAGLEEEVQRAGQEDQLGDDLAQHRAAGAVGLVDLDALVLRRVDLDRLLGRIRGRQRAAFRRATWDQLSWHASFPPRRLRGVRYPRRYP